VKPHTTDPEPPPAPPADDDTVQQPELTQDELAWENAETDGFHE
jgi:hypothetical protein